MHNMLCCCRPCTQRRHLQLISDYFEGAFAAAVPWTSFTLRFPEAEVGSRNLTRELLAVAADVTRLRQLQSNLQMYARDVLWEAPDSRAGSYALSLATHALRDVCTPGAAGQGASAAQPALEPPTRTPGPQVIYTLGA